MMEPEDVKRFRRHLRAAGIKVNDAEALGQLAALHRELGEIIGECARTLNGRGVSWRQLGAATGISYQTLHYRYGKPSPALRDVVESPPVADRG